VHLSPASPWHRGALAILAGVAAVTFAPSPHGRAAAEHPADERPLVCPAGGRWVSPAAPLQRSVDETRSGGTVCLAPGAYTGPLAIGRPVTVLGRRDAIVRSPGAGTTITVEADGVTLDGFTVDGTGTRLDTMDAAVRVHGTDLTIQALTIRRALFGIVADRSTRVTVAGNVVEGRPELPAGERGDGIRFWEARGSTIRDNTVAGARDIAVWYSPGTRVTANHVTGSRYAAHFMYSHDSVVEGNVFERDMVGVFVMYSRNLTIAGNTIRQHTAGDGLAIGSKESGNLRIEGNRLMDSIAALYLDLSPFRAGDWVLVRGNTIGGSGTGVIFHSSEAHNTFVDNTFAGNEVQVSVEGQGTAERVLWRGNYFDDYQGYDFDGDGRGDVPYELRRLSERLVAVHPELNFFRGTPALMAVDLAARLLPFLQPARLLADNEPRMAPPAPAGSAAGDRRGH
jgi:nitrous oxidase accessory protein